MGGAGQQQPQQQQHSWSYSFAAGSDGQLTSQRCSEALTSLLRHSINVLPLAVESCSHPTGGLDSLLLQPYSYAGGGLGNFDECPLKTCLALQPGRDGMPPYAGVCVPAECQASDLTSYDFVATLRRNLVVTADPQQQQREDEDDGAAPKRMGGSNKRGAVQPAPTISADEWKRQVDWANEYVTIFERIGEIGQYLPSGWTCGEWRYPIPLEGTTRVVWCAYVIALGALVVGTTVGTYRGWQYRRRNRRKRISRLQVESDREAKTMKGDGCEGSQHDESEQLIELRPVGVPVDASNGASSSSTMAAETPRTKHVYGTLLLSTPQLSTTTTTPRKIYSTSTSVTDNSSPESDDYRHDDTDSDTSPLLRSPVSAVTKSLLVTTPGIGSLTMTATVPPASSELKGRYDVLSRPSSPPKFDNNESSGWDAFDWYDNHSRLVQLEKSAETSALGTDMNDTTCLHGVRVISLLWIVLGHTAAIASSTGPGYSNPGDVLPPHGWAITLQGQLIFASRFAVDTFLVLSGFLLVITASKMFHSASAFTQTKMWPIVMIMSRIARIVPTYLTCLGIFVFVAPRYWGSGAFWYQWQSLLQPCTEYGWTNLLFVNNFYPTDTSTTNTCFYHSWYLAVDVQVFVLGVLVLVVYRRSHMAGLATASFLFVAMTVMQAILTHERNWSLNTFDGAAVARYDVEAYAKPHVRAPSYLAGMICAMMLLHRQKRRGGERVNRALATTNEDCRDLEDPAESGRHRVKSICTATTVLACCATMGFVTFCTASGAYARRPCQYGEWPHEAGCGSLWSPRVTFLYTAFSRTLWVLSVSTLLFLMCGTNFDNDDASSEPPVLLQLVRSFLSMPIWTLPSRLSFASYLMHPIWLFVWQLGAPSSKYAWRWTTFAMQYMAVCVMTLASSYAISIVVEAPCARLWKRAMISSSASRRAPGHKCGFSDLERRRPTVSATPEKSYPKVLQYGSVDGV